MDYFVHDCEFGDGMVVDGAVPVDAAQKFIDVIGRVQPGRNVNPYNLSIYPISRRNVRIDPVNPRDQETS